MSTPAEIVEAQEVLKPGQRSLRELADEANREHGLVVETGASMVEHAFKAGLALHEAERQCPPGQWTDWLRANFAASPATGRLYMRLADHRESIRAAGVDGIGEARAYLTRVGVPERRNGVKTRFPQWMQDEAVRMKRSGMSGAGIARELGVSTGTILRWTDPQQYAREQAAHSEAAKRKRAAARALREQERQQAIKRAVRKAGAATQEAWAMAERMQDVLAQAHRETEDREARRALSEAGVHYRKMRDEIVRALGVS